jgi:hypothetical protein
MGEIEIKGYGGRHDNQHNDNQHNDILDKGPNCDTQLAYVLDVIMPSVAFSHFYAECHYAELSLCRMSICSMARFQMETFREWRVRNT